MPGLVVVSTPIGNMGDISKRAIDAFCRADIIACEDTRQFKKLLSLAGVKTKAALVSYHQHNEGDAAERICSLLKQGKRVALVSDAGTPLISDAGYKLVRLAIEKGIDVDHIPGPCAAVSALVLSGLPCDNFLFVGFLPKKKGRLGRLKEIKEIAQHSKSGITFVFYESPNRVLRLLDDLIAIFGKDAGCALCREMTKAFQEVIRGTLDGLKRRLEGGKILGECVLVVYLPKKKKRGDDEHNRDLIA